MSTDSTLTEDLQQNLRAADRLVNILGAQRNEVERAYARGWAECGEALAYIAAEAWEAGYWAREADRQVEWEELSARIRSIGDSPTFEDRRAAELAACGPRPGDFPGLDNDPRCLEPIRASMEAITHKHLRAAA